jgi:hypothetical protein
MNGFDSMESETTGQTRAEYLKKWREDHREHIAEWNKAYYQKHREALDAKKAHKFGCDVCGGKYTSSNKSIHERTNRHQRALSNP